MSCIRLVQKTILLNSETRVQTISSQKTHALNNANQSHKITQVRTAYRTDAVRISLSTVTKFRLRLLVAGFRAVRCLSPLRVGESTRHFWRADCD